MSENRLIKLYERAKTWKWSAIIRVVEVLGALALLAFLWHSIFVAPDNRAREAGQAKQDVRAANSEAGVAQTTMHDMQTRTIVQEKTHEIVRENTREILSAPGASDKVPAAVDAAFRSSIERLRDQAGQHHDEADRLPEVRR